MNCLLILSLLFAATFAAQLRWEDCSNPKIVSASTVDLTPQPIKIPGKLKISVTGNLLRTIDGNIKIEMRIYKKVLGIWVRIPCVSGVGSCDYNNGCDMVKDLIKKVQNDVLGGDCPKLIVDKMGVDCATAKAYAERILRGECIQEVVEATGVPCIRGCPIQPFSVSVANEEVDIPSLPTGVGWLASGEYRVELYLKKNGGDFACLKAWAKIAS